MRHGRRVAIWALVNLAWALSSSAGTAIAKDEGWWSGLDEGLPVALADVLADAEPFRHRTITFTCVFHSRENTYDPLHTPFNAERFDNFSVWPDGLPLWDGEAYRKDYPFVYIPRNHPDRDALLGLEPMTRIQMTGKIRAVTRVGAFFEVFSWRRTGHRLGEDVVQAVIRGDNYIRSGARNGYQLAARQYREALRPDLPETYAQRIRARLAESLRRLGHLEEARQVEQGPTLGADPLPAPPDPHGSDPGLPAPGVPEAPLEPPPTSIDPGSPDGPAQGPPALPPSPATPSGPQGVGAGGLEAAPVLPEDALPGRRFKPSVLTPPAGSSPAEGAGPAGFPPAVPAQPTPGVPVGPGSPDGEASAPPPPPPPAKEAASGIPPTRRTRLSGVK